MLHFITSLWNFMECLLVCPSPISTKVMCHVEKFQLKLQSIIKNKDNLNNTKFVLTLKWRLTLFFMRNFLHFYMIPPKNLFFLYKQNLKIFVSFYINSWFVGPNIKLEDCLAAFFTHDELKGMASFYWKLPIDKNCW